jgi:hypothetical protein
MKKITSILIIIGVFACFGNVFSHDIGVKKAIGVELTINSFDQPAVIVSDFNYEAIDFTSNSITFTPYLISNEKANFITILESFDEDVSHILIFNTSNDKNTKCNITYAIAPNRLCIEIMLKVYPIISPTPLPKHYLLPAKNNFYRFGSNQRNC